MSNVHTTTGDNQSSGSLWMVFLFIAFALYGGAMFTFSYQAEQIEAEMQDPRFHSISMTKAFNLLHESEYRRYTASTDPEGLSWSLHSMSPDGIRYTRNNKLHHIAMDTDEMEAVYGKSRFFTLVASETNTCTEHPPAPESDTRPISVNKFCLYTYRDMGELSKQESFEHWMKLKKDIHEGLSNAHDLITQHIAFTIF